MGIMKAINLVERGLSIVIVEKGNIAGEQFRGIKFRLSHIK